jgi:serine O-acetyltransferase
MPLPISRQLISSTDPDWTRESKSFFAWRPGQSLVASLRSHQRWRRQQNPIGYALRILAVVRHRFWSVITGADIPLGTKIGGGLLLAHPNGIVIHGDVVIGPNCLILQQVTLGDRAGGVPKVGGHVDIGAGARILGNVIIGDHAKIGANAVVLEDVPPHSTAVGVPARIVMGTQESQSSVQCVSDVENADS